MRRLIASAAVLVMTVLGLVAVTGPTQAKVPGPNGRIVSRPPRVYESTNRRVGRARDYRMARGFIRRTFKPVMVLPTHRPRADTALDLLVSRRAGSEP